MAHQVSFTIPERTLGKADVEFYVKKNKNMIGRLKVSSGAVEWVPRDARYGYKVVWTEFDDLMKKNGRKG